MMDINEFNLNQLMEECSEVIKRASKQKRFGRNEIQPGHTQTNAERLRDECLDVLLCIKFLEVNGQIERITAEDVQEHLARTQPKIDRMRNYSRSLGTLEPEK